MVNQGNHNGRANVIHHGQRDQECPQPRGNPVSKNSQDGNRKGRIGCHRDGPASDAGSLPVEKDKDQGGNEHTPNGPGNRQRGLARGT